MWVKEDFDDVHRAFREHDELQKKKKSLEAQIRRLQEEATGVDMELAQNEARAAELVK